MVHVNGPNKNSFTATTGLKQAFQSHNIVLIGMPGSGKTTLAKLLSEHMTRQVVDTDVVITQNYGDIPSLFTVSEDHFRKIETEVIRKASLAQGTIIATGGGAVTRPENMNYLARRGIVFFIDRPIELLYQEVEIEDRPLLTDNRDHILELYNQRLPLYRQFSHHTINNSGTKKEAVDQFVAILKEKYGLQSNQ